MKKGMNSHSGTIHSLIWNRIEADNNWIAVHNASDGLELFRIIQQFLYQ